MCRDIEEGGLRGSLGRFIIVSFFVLICFGAMGQGFQDRLVLKVMAGTGGYVRPGAMTPITVVLENDDEDRFGHLAVSIGQGGVFKQWATKVVPLPPFAKKRVTLYLMCPSGFGMMGFAQPEVMVRYHSKQGKVKASLKENLRRLRVGRPVFGAIGRFPVGLPASTLGDGSVLFSELILRADQLADRFDGLEMFDAIFIIPGSGASLSAKQVSALHDWILRGGTLVVDTSKRADVFQRGSLSELLPFTPGKVTTMVLDAFGDEPVSIAEGRSTSGEVILESNDLPIIIRQNLGLGSVVCLAVDPLLSAWEGMAGVDAAWHDILGEQPFINSAENDLVGSEGDTGARSLASYVSMAPKMELRFGLVLILIILYAIVVGPFDYWFVRKLGRPKLTWITFPAIVAAFTLVAYAGASAWVGGELRSTAARHMLYLPDEGLALRLDILGLSTKNTDSYLLSHATCGAVQHLGPALGVDDESMYLMDEGLLRQEIPIWSSRVYRASFNSDETSGIDVELDKSESNAITVKITNNRDSQLKAGWVMYGNGYWRAFTKLEPGASWNVVIGKKGHSDTRNRSSNTYDDSLLTREFSMLDALRRGALIVGCDDDNEIDSELLVNGRTCSVPGQRSMVRILQYPEF